MTLMKMPEFTSDRALLEFCSQMIQTRLQERIDEINDQIKQFHSVSPYLRGVMPYVQPSNILAFADIDPYDFLMALYVSRLSYEDAQNYDVELLEIKNLLTQMDSREFAAALGKVTKLSKYLIKNALSFQKNTFKGQEKLLAVDHTCDILQSDEFLKCCSKLIIYASFQKDIIDGLNILKLHKAKAKEKKGLTDACYEDAKNNGILDDFNRIIQKCIEFEKQEKAEMSTLKQKRNILEDLIGQIRRGDFTELSEKEEQLIGPICTQVVYLYNRLKNAIEIQSLSRQIEGLSYLEVEYKNETLLAQYQIDAKKLSDEEKEAILEVNPETLQNWMEQLTTLNIAPSALTPTALRQILQYGNLETVPELQVMITRDFVTPTFLKEHPEVFVTLENEELEPRYDTITQNQVLLEKMNIDVHDKSYQPDVLLTNPSDMASRVSLLQMYQIDSAKSKYLMSLLSGDISFDTIDTMIEASLTPNNMKLGKMKMSQDEFGRFRKRVAIAKQLGWLGTPRQGVSSTILFEGSKFQVPDAALDEFTADATAYYLDPDMVKVLRKSKRDHYDGKAEELAMLHDTPQTLVYQFGDTKISAPKVKRNLQALKDAGYEGRDALFQSCIYGSILSFPQITEIQNTIYRNQTKEKVQV